MTLFYCILFIIAVNGMNEKLFQGINKQSYQEEITLESLIPQELISLNTHLSKIKPKECNNIGSCMKYIDNTTDEMIHGIASEVHKTFSSTMQKYTQLAYLVIISSIRENKYIEVTDWINLLSLSAHKGHCLLEFIYRANIKYDKALFNNYLFFSDLENIFTASVDKPYTNEKLLQLIEDKTKIPRPSDKNEVYKELLNNIHQMQTKISQLSDRFCSITNSWFHPNNLKFKKVIHNAGLLLKERIENNYTHLEHKQVFSKCNKSKWYDCIRSENDMEVLFQFSNLVIKSMIQEVGHSAVVYLDVYSYILNDLKKKISNGLDVNESISRHTSKKLRIMIHEYLNNIQKIKNLIFDKHGIEVDLNNDLCEKIKYIYNELYIKLENILDQKYVLNIIKELRKKIQKYREIISENINYKYDISEIIDQINWNNSTYCLDGQMCYKPQSILELLV
ncbi:uncharacterized protein LOC126901808 isoform X12 [Daktulosphaira vitifoliae]|uniref:uncharacterized protein LOC126901808 isoform X12 n=1 Tax=Daktulosphaira vitifoliae TaxID=58002 RepID=UPI0021AA6205|nr:uncharacterized protein LOC126901808 isoform X12 [Daktulosphaira vitifoliae]